MTNIPEDLNFQIVLDSDRQASKKLVDSPAQSQDLSQNIKLSSQTDSNQKRPIIKAVQQQGGNAYDLKKAGHPTICVLTFAFKLASLIIYLLIGAFISNILTFIFVIILSAIDFWFTKNVSGRLLVGLRWRSQYDQNGKQNWKFQSYNHNFKPNSVDKLFFWASQAAFTAVWALFLILNIITLSIFWSLLLFITGGLCATNLYGYYQCRGDHKNKLQGLKKQYGKKVFKSLAERYL